MQVAEHEISPFCRLVPTRSHGFCRGCSMCSCLWMVGCVCCGCRVLLLLHCGALWRQRGYSRMVFVIPPSPLPKRLRSALPTKRGASTDECDFGPTRRPGTVVYRHQQQPTNKPRTENRLQHSVRLGFATSQSLLHSDSIAAVRSAQVPVLVYCGK